jgi:MFS family permease
MSDAATYVAPGTDVTRRRRWLTAAAIGCALVVLAMLVVALVIWDKPQFGWLVGTWFLPFITSGVFVGAAILLVAAWNMPERKTWRGIVLMIWAVIALTSPAFGFLILGPWTLLALSLPVVIWILMGMRGR